MQKVRALLFKPVNSAWLGLFRAAFGVLMLFDITQYFQRGWIQENYIDAVFHFKFYGFDWVSPLPGAGMGAYFFVLAILSICIALGYQYRPAIILFFLCYTYMWLIDVTLFVEWNYLVSLIAFLLIFTPAGQVLSLDNRINKREDAGQVPFWTLFVLRFQFAVVYIFGGINKLNPDWMSGDLVRGWMAAGYPVPFMGRIPLQSEPLIHLLSWCGIGIDLFVVPLLLFRRTRAIALFAAVLFHLSNALWFNVGIFPYLMIIGTLLFLEPDRFQWAWGRRPAAPTSMPAPASASFAPRNPILIALFLYCALQILIPLRHQLYPGDPNWTEEGIHGSWFLYTRNKLAAVQFIVTDGAGTTYPVEKDLTTQILTNRQYFYMVQDPGLILQYAHYLGNELRRQGMDVRKISAQTSVRMNMRPQRPMIDPEVNLLEQVPSYAHKKWVMPSE